MGCRQTHALFDKKSIENEKVSKFEETFNLHQKDSSFYEGILSRLTNSTLSPAQTLESFQKFTKTSLSENLKSQLLKTFSTDSKFDLQSFQCFCVIFSKSSENDKAESLWYIFDVGLKDSLTSADIRKMLTGVIRASVGVALEMFIKAELYDGKKMTEWQAYLNERVESLVVKLLKHFTQQKENVGKDEFLLRIQDRPEGLITSTAGIRTQLELTQVIPNKFANPFKNMRITKLTG